MSETAIRRCAKSAAPTSVRSQPDASIDGRRLADAQLRGAPDPRRGEQRPRGHRVARRSRAESAIRTPRSAGSAPHPRTPSHQAGKNCAIYTRRGAAGIGAPRGTLDAPSGIMDRPLWQILIPIFLLGSRRIAPRWGSGSTRATWGRRSPWHTVSRPQPRSPPRSRSGSAAHGRSACWSCSGSRWPRPRSLEGFLVGLAVRRSLSVGRDVDDRPVDGSARARVPPRVR